MLKENLICQIVSWKDLQKGNKKKVIGFIKDKLG